MTMILNDESLVSLLSARASNDGERLFARFNDNPISFGELDRTSDAFAAALRCRGIAPGDRAAVMMRNSIPALAVLFGLARAGAVWVPVNIQQRAHGLRYILEHCEPNLIVCDEEFLGDIRGCGAQIDSSKLVVFGDANAFGSLEHLSGSADRFREPPPRPHDPFAIMYTSGTTGRPKGVVVSHRMMRLAGEGVCLAAETKPGDIMFVWEPLYHIGGAQLLLLPLIRDVELAFVDRFSASRFWRQVKDAKATHIHYLGGILQILLKQDSTASDLDHNVRIAWGAGCPMDQWRLFEERFGVQIRECYGMTEASSLTTINNADRIGSIGRPVPWFSVSLLDKDGQPTPAGERGEIVVRANVEGALSRGYFRDAEATARVLRNGALHTGDIGSLDPGGNLTFHGRLTDSLRVRGENISAWEIEHVVASHPNVQECAVVGVQAEIGEQEIKLFVKAKHGREIEFPELSVWLSQHLAPYQNPRYIALVEDFERTPSQRIVKRTLSTDLRDCWDRSSSKSALQELKGELVNNVSAQTD